MNNDYTAGGTVTAKTYPGTPGPSRPGDIAPNFPNPAPSGPGDIAPYNPGQTGGFGSGVGADDVSNFSVLKLQEVLNELKTQNSSIRNELAHVADLAGALGSGVRSGDSNLSDAWFSVRDSVSKFYGRFSDLETSYDTEISKYIEETIALEMNAALNVEAVSEEINDISSQLDSLFGM